MPDQVFTEVSYARRDEAGWIALDRPAQRNALTPVMIAELHLALDLAGQDPAVRALVITGAGPAFCAGADLGYFQSQLDAGDGCLALPGPGPGLARVSSRRRCGRPLPGGGRPGQAPGRCCGPPAP